MISKPFGAGNLPNGEIGWQHNVRAHCGIGLRCLVSAWMAAVAVAALAVEGVVPEVVTHRVQPQRCCRQAACDMKAQPVSAGTQRVTRTAAMGCREPWLHGSVYSSASETSFDWHAHTELSKEMRAYPNGKQISMIVQAMNYLAVHALDPRSLLAGLVTQLRSQHHPKPRLGVPHLQRSLRSTCLAYAHVKRALQLAQCCGRCTHC